jgi:mannose-1-phosphate guanylyltransferase
MFAVIMAGGSGTRFWPASRERLPKQFLSITGKRTLFEETMARVEPLVGGDNVYVVVNRVHEETTRHLLAGSHAQVLVEPVGRNTAACIGLAAAHIRRRDAEQPILVLPSDHFVADPARFKLTLTAVAEAAQSGAIITIGVPPNRPETGYGYIQVGEPWREVHGRPFYGVKRFVEKPGRETALEYLSAGGYLWNSGIFCFTAGTILEEIKRCAPDLYKGLSEVESSIGTADYGDAIERIYPELASISIDNAVMEKTEAQILVAEADFGWSDVGSWQSVYELRAGEHDANGNLLSAETVALDAAQNFVHSAGGRTIALVGVHGLVVIDTPDALLVADINRSQDIKLLPELLRQRGSSGVC